MFLKFLIFTISFLWVGSVSASTLRVDEQEFASNTNNKWSLGTPFKEENKNEDEKELSETFRDHYDRGHEWKEDERHFDFGKDDLEHRDDRWHHGLKDCDKPSPVPIPGALPLFLSGIASIIGFARHKKHRTK